jgi:hypothetical protein
MTNAYEEAHPNLAQVDIWNLRSCREQRLASMQ